MRLATVILAVISFDLSPVSVALGQDGPSRDQRDMLVASIKYVGSRIPQGAVINLGAADRFLLVERTSDFLREVASETGLGALDVHPLLQACSGKGPCSLGVPAYVNLRPPRFLDDHAEVDVTWVSGQSGEIGLLGGYTAVLRLAKRNNRWAVTEQVELQHFTMGPPMPRKSE